uniref:Activin types I and II receptor domain-containing protein n=1 Tax=Romanomermis culicivorax TaxID=13658 RepID=A0A915JVS7_ROMCU
IQECVCDGSLCNHKSLADYSLTVVRPPPSTGALASPQAFGSTSDSSLLRCYSCVQTSNEHLVHSSACRSEMCLGQFCLLILESSSQQQGFPGGGLADSGARSSSTGSSSSDVSSASMTAAVNAFYRRTAGCLNSSRPDFVLKGCTQKWTMKKWEKIECVCDRDLCNVDAMTARSSLNWRIMATEWTIAKILTICALIRFTNLSCFLL